MFGTKDLNDRNYKQVIELFTVSTLPSPIKNRKQHSALTL